MVIDIDKVTLMQKVEVFEETLRLTSGDDLRQALWMKSPKFVLHFGILKFFVIKLHILYILYNNLLNKV